jgi:hypothetical protein
MNPFTHHRRARFAAAVTAAAATATVIGLGALIGASPVSAAGEALSPTSLVETYDYPGAAAIEAAKGIKLIRGDGNITLADCGSAPDLIQVESYHDVQEGVYCFAVRGAKGHLELEIPNVFFIWAGDEDVAATVTVAGVESDPIVVPANDGESVGASDPRNHAVLLELNV